MKEGALMLSGTFTPYGGTNTEWCKRCTRPKSEHVRPFPGLDVLSCPSAKASNARDAWITTAIMCGILAVIALFVFLQTGNAVSQCDSSLGQLAQGLVSNAATRCGYFETVHDLVFTGLIVLSLGTIGAIWKASKK